MMVAGLVSVKNSVKNNVERYAPSKVLACASVEYLQLDPLQIIARSHDLQLHNRVLDYRPGMWEDVTFGQRQFFDWSGWLGSV
jgi:uncharacterized protein YcaQ